MRLFVIQLLAMLGGVQDLVLRLRLQPRPLKPLQCNNETLDRQQMIYPPLVHLHQVLRQILATARIQILETLPIDLLNLDTTITIRRLRGNERMMAMSPDQEEMIETIARGIRFRGETMIVIVIQKIGGGMMRGGVVGVEVEVTRGEMNMIRGERFIEINASCCNLSAFAIQIHCYPHSIRLPYNVAARAARGVTFPWLKYILRNAKIRLTFFLDPIP
jgi:hypothetical protein